MHWQLAYDMSSVITDDSRKYREPVYGLDNRAVQSDTGKVMDIELEIYLYRIGLMRPARTDALAMIERIEGLRLV